MTFSQSPTPPKVKFPIVCIGAGGIMRNAHLPAYRMCGFEVVSLSDTKHDLAQDLAKEFGIKIVPTTLEEQIATAPKDAIFDLAVPAAAHANILRQLPTGSFALLQKPMGETLAQAEEILSVCEERNICAAVNFQLRWAPYTLALKSLLATGKLGEILDVEFKINVHTPWADWYFLELAPRMEMVYHSIHYVDLIRDLLGEPHRVWARAIKHPDAPKLESSRSFIYYEYGDNLRATVSTYHAHKAGPKHQQSYLKIEGTKGCAFMQMGLNLNYPRGGEDFLEYWLDGDADWTNVPLEGGWFPHAFRGPMSAMMDWKSGGDPPSTEVHGSIHTMQLVEDAYRASDSMRVSG